MHFTSLWAAALCLLGVTIAWPVYTPTLKTFPSYPLNGTSTIQYAAKALDFDGPKVDFFNASAFQWWYFDVVSDDLKESIVLIFFTNGPGATGTNALPFNIAEANIQLSNGTLVAVGAAATELAINTVLEGSSGVMNGTGYAWGGTPDLSYYGITVDDKLNNLQGTIQIYSDAPSHASCGPATPGASLLVSNQLGWANSIPDGTAIVDLTYNGIPLKYTGRGYHDSNWGAIPMEIMGTYYWGHARFGPYAIVWFDMLDLEGVEHQLGYLSENGRILANSCGSLTVRGTGANSTYPPSANQSPTGFHIVYDMGHEGTLEVNVTNTEIIQIEPPLYMRWVGSVVGGIQGKETYEGVSLYEWMIGYSGPLP
ncbi:hypothetical protein CALCODRAFT_521993 [Calocera cornea HHB12733]|uniref:AttH domain-containing protein n=1 Tax=Calocera cornea HHB12733 TaxID=1353952 RepID=A0A165C7Y0_9BASI|nr:hypothetical protein CALCODRAFT_521993 [Calocera cornea HHB12733]